jgi:hypothetical protein
MMASNNSASQFNGIGADDDQIKELSRDEKHTHNELM